MEISETDFFIFFNFNDKNLIKGNIEENQNIINSFETYKKINNLDYYYFVKKFSNFIISFFNKLIEETNKLEICFIHYCLSKIRNIKLYGNIDNNLIIKFNNFYYKYFFILYDNNFYLQYNQDLKQIKNKNNLLNHWYYNGIFEDRVASLKYIYSIFDFKFYSKIYPDLKNNGIITNNSLFTHYIKYGFKEKRLINYYNEIKNFDIDFYRKCYNIDNKGDFQIIEDYIYNYSNLGDNKKINEKRFINQNLFMVNKEINKKLIKILNTELRELEDLKFCKHIIQGKKYFSNLNSFLEENKNLINIKDKLNTILNNNDDLSLNEIYNLFDKEIKNIENNDNEKNVKNNNNEKIYTENKNDIKKNVKNNDNKDNIKNNDNKENNINYDIFYKLNKNLVDNELNKIEKSYSFENIEKVYNIFLKNEVIFIKTFEEFLEKEKISLEYFNLFQPDFKINIKENYNEFLNLYLNKNENGFIFNQEDFYKKYRHFDLNFFKKFNNNIENQNEINCQVNYHINFENNRLIGSIYDFCHIYKNYKVDKNNFEIEKLIEYHNVKITENYISIDTLKGLYQDFDFDFYNNIYNLNIENEFDALKHYHFLGKKEGKLCNYNSSNNKNRFNFKKYYDEINENKKDKYNKKNKLWCNLYCHDIILFNEIYEKIIKNITKFFNVIVTYSNGNKIPDYDFIYLKIPEKGLYIGSIFFTVAYFLDNNIDYTHLLFLDPNIKKSLRNQYFKKILENFDFNNLNDNIGIYTLNILKKSNDNWETYSHHMNNMIKKLNLPHFNNLYPEENVYILQKELVEYIYDNRFNLYQKLNDRESFDYVWFINKYDIYKELSYAECYNFYKKKNLLGSNFILNKKLDNFHIEETFKLIILGVCKLLNKRIKILKNIKIKKIEKKNLESIKNLDQNNEDNKICIFHCGNISIFDYLIKRFPVLKNFYLLITYYNKLFTDKLKDYNFKKYKLLKVDNIGMDCGPMLISIKYLLNNNNLYNKNTIFYKIHTKNIDDWRDSLISKMLEFNDFDLYKKKPYIFGDNKYVYSDIKGVDKININKIVKRNNICKNIDDFYDNYYEEYVSGNTENKFTDLIPSLNFYKNYEPDLKWVIDMEHWEKYGIKEFHRKSNVNYIKKYKKFNNYFIAGTIFGFNQKYLELFKNYNLDHEYSILEPGYVSNSTLTKLHAWEYYFGLLPFLNDGLIIGVDEKKISIYKNKLCSKKMKYSVINVPFKKSDIAIFLILPGEKPDSGGYRTILKYINYLNNNNYSLDIYFGISWNDNELYSNVEKLNDDGIPCCDNWLDPKNYNIIFELINNIKKYNIIDEKKNNFYLGLKCQRNYKILIANAWQIADAVYKNKDNSDKLFYLIQDREELFYPDNPEMQKDVVKTYKKEYYYYCITQYLGDYFKKTYNLKNVRDSYMGVDIKIYKNLNLNREKSVVIPYYKDIKKGRKPHLVKKIIKILSENNIKCYVYPYDIEKEDDNQNIINLGIQTEKGLNELYNKHKVGIIFSNTNPSRLGFEMYASGIHVIEYESEFTKYDMPDKYFEKIKDENNIVETVNKLFEKKYDNGFLKNIDINKDYKNFLNYIEENLDI
jgi:hypothetical protein